MASTERHGKLAEILVERYEDLGVLRRARENFVVAGIGAPISYPFHFMPRALELRFRAGPDAAVQQELQAASSVTMGSTRSWPTTRRA